MFPSLRSIANRIGSLNFVSNVLDQVKSPRMFEFSSSFNVAETLKSISPNLSSLSAVRFHSPKFSFSTLQSTPLLNSALGLAVGASAFLLMRSNSSLALRGSFLILGALALSACGARTGLRTDSSSDSSACRQEFGTNFESLATPSSSEIFLRPMGIGGPQGQFVCYAEQNAASRNASSLYFLNRNISQAPQLLTNRYSNHATPGNCSISDDGRLVAVIESVGSSDVNTDSQVVLYRAQGTESNQTWIRETVGNPSYGLGHNVRLSASGREVFLNYSIANSFQIYNIQTRTLQTLSTGKLSPFGSFSVSEDGNRIAFAAYYLGWGFSLNTNVYLHDRRDGSTVEISQSLTPSSSAYSTMQPFISGDGSRVFFRQNFSMSDGGDILHEWREGRGLRVISTQADNNLPASGILQINGVNRQGNRLLIATNAQNFASGVNIGNRGLELFLWDLESNRRVLVSEDTCESSILTSESLIDASGRYGVGNFYESEDRADQVQPLLGINFDQYSRP